MMSEISYKRIWLCIFAALIAYSVLQQDISVAEEIDFSPALPVMQTIDGERMLFHIKFLASEEMRGRALCSQEQLIAARYIACEFEKYRLKPVGDDGTYYQNFTLTSPEVTAPGILVIGDKVYAEGENLKTYAIGTAEVTAPVVFNGNGGAKPEFDVKGKLLVEIVSPQGAIRQQVINAVERGVAGLLLIADENHYIWDVWYSTEGVGHQYIFDLLFGSLIAPIRARMATFPVAFITPEIAKDFELKSTATLRTQVTIKQRKTMNVVGLVEGSDHSLKEEVVIIGAHFDHIGVDKTGKAYPGASDNASGVAGVLEIARAFASDQVKTKRSILFIAFTGEEQGWRIGSEYYVKHPLIPQGKTVAMINLDVIGTPGFPTVVGEKVPMRDVAEQASKIIGVKLEYHRSVVSDHISFRVKNIPTFFCTSCIICPDLHRTTDTWDKLDPVKLEEIARLDFLVAWWTAQPGEELNPSVPVKLQGKLVTTWGAIRTVR